MLTQVQQNDESYQKGAINLSEINESDWTKSVKEKEDVSAYQDGSIQLIIEVFDLKEVFIANQVNSPYIPKN